MISHPHVMGPDLWTRIHPCGCWGKAGEAFTTSGAPGQTPFYRLQDFENLSKTHKNADTPEIIRSGGRTLIWKVAPGARLLLRNLSPIIDSRGGRHS